jgi:hypothetical protein
MCRSPVTADDGHTRSRRKHDLPVSQPAAPAPQLRSFPAVLVAAREPTAACPRAPNSSVAQQAGAEPSAASWKCRRAKLGENSSTRSVLDSRFVLPRRRNLRGHRSRLAAESAALTAGDPWRPTFARRIQAKSKQPLP